MKKKNLFVIAFAILTIVVMILALSKVIDETLGMCLALSMTVIFNFIVAFMAYKSDIKAVAILMTLFMVVGIVLLGMNIYGILSKNVAEKAPFEIAVSENTSPKTSIFTYEQKEYFTYNLNEVEITLKNKEKYSLKDAIQGGHITLDEILSYAIANDDTKGYDIYYDGGTGKSLKDKYSVVVCDSNDVIFAPYTYTYEEAICKD